MYRIYNIGKVTCGCSSVFPKHFIFKNSVTNKVKCTYRLASNVKSNFEKLFPRKEDFPSRHIGPREHDQTAMLDLLGFKVRVYAKNKSHSQVFTGHFNKICHFIQTQLKYKYKLRF